MSAFEKSVDFWVEELTHDINPEHFNHHENFIPYMHDEKISSFGDWMWNNGYNVGLVNLQTKVNTYCVPQWTSHKTTTFKPIDTDTRGYACQFRCNVCGCTVSTAYYMRPDQFDYNCCPYCGRPVESEDDAENGCMKEASEGKWIIHFDDLFPEDSTQECSICHAEQYLRYGDDDNYCPNCGAKMKQAGKG